MTCIFSLGISEQLLYPNKLLGRKRLVLRCGLLWLHIYTCDLPLF